MYVTRTELKEYCMGSLLKNLLIHCYNLLVLLKYTGNLLNYTVNLLGHMGDFTDMYRFIIMLTDPLTNSAVGVNRVIAPFVACGDLSGFDSDMTYPVQVMVCFNLTFVHMNHMHSALQSIEKKQNKDKTLHTHTHNSLAK